MLLWLSGRNKGTLNYTSRKYWIIDYFATMDSICEDLGIPRQQIKETNCSDRFIIFAHKSWLKCLLKKKKIIEFPIHSNIIDWHDWHRTVNVGHPWTTVHITVSLFILP